MPIAPGELLAPVGPIELDLFPGEDEDDALLVRLSNYIGQAEIKVTPYALEEGQDKDNLVRTWSLYLAFRAAYTLSLARPAEDQADVEVLGRTQYDRDQRDGLKLLADEYFAEFQVLVAQSVTSSSTVSTGIPSHQTPNRYDY